MPQRKKPIKQRPKVEDESTGNPTEYHGKHREQDEALPGRGGTKGGLNKNSGGGTLGTKQNRDTSRHDQERSTVGRPRSEGPEPRRAPERSDLDTGGSHVYPAREDERADGADVRLAGDWRQKPD
jgi:hypothetical protein